ncbi:hypothetical protein [Roseateles aquatilis]|uniref:hypothetical protein n=1 Tax=Roseateles aquatilis TaxID=431061 RepID=UPI0011316C78
MGVTEAQVRESVGHVGKEASDVEVHLRGTRSTTNAELNKNALRVEQSTDVGQAPRDS